jgi:phage gp36-like protein
VKAEAKDTMQKRTKLTVSFLSLLLNLNLSLGLADYGKTL